MIELAAILIIIALSPVVLIILGFIFVMIIEFIDIMFQMFTGRL